MTLDDAGCGNDLRRGFACSTLILESIQVWKQFILASSPKQQKRNEVRDISMPSFGAKH